MSDEGYMFTDIKKLYNGGYSLNIRNLFTYRDTMKFSNIQFFDAKEDGSLAMTADFVMNISTHNCCDYKMTMSDGSVIDTTNISDITYNPMMLYNDKKGQYDYIKFKDALCFLNGSQIYGYMTYYYDNCCKDLNRNEILKDMKKDPLKYLYSRVSKENHVQLDFIDYNINKTLDIGCRLLNDPYEKNYMHFTRCHLIFKNPNILNNVYKFYEKELLWRDRDFFDGRFY